MVPQAFEDGVVDANVRSRGEVNLNVVVETRRLTVQARRRRLVTLGRFRLTFRFFRLRGLLKLNGICLAGKVCQLCRRSKGGKVPGDRSLVFARDSNYGTFNLIVVRIMHRRINGVEVGIELPYLLAKHTSPKGRVSQSVVILSRNPIII